MGLSKFDESHQREFTRAIEIGQENAEYIENAQNWCKHFRIKMVSAGLFAQMSELPIGSHSISCQYAEGCTESINLPWIIPDFIVEHCSNCAYHEPNGNDLWGKTIVEDRQKQNKSRKKQNKSINSS